MERAFDQVTNFHHAYGQDAPRSAIILPRKIQLLRFRLIREEFKEYRDAVVMDDITEIADALADLSYVVIGTAVAHGLTRFGDIFDEVHRSNMSKLGADNRPIRRADGKVLKGPNFTLPDLERFIRLGGK